jgi:hypothetical protein
MLLPMFEWLNSLPVSRAISESLWAFAVIQAFHLLALAVLLGAVLVVDLRLMGSGMRGQPLAQVARDARPWLIGGFIGMVITGLPQMMSNASRVYYSDYFWMKMYLLTAALIFTFTLRHKVTQADETRVGLWGKVVGLVSIALWASIAIHGRLIGLF